MLHIHPYRRPQEDDAPGAWGVRATTGADVTLLTGTLEYTRETHLVRHAILAALAVHPDQEVVVHAPETHCPVVAHAMHGRQVTYTGEAPRTAASLSTRRLPTLPPGLRILLIGGYLPPRTLPLTVPLLNLNTVLMMHGKDAYLGEAGTGGARPLVRVPRRQGLATTVRLALPGGIPVPGSAYREFLMRLT